MVLKTCISLGLEQRLHSPYEKSIVERTIEYLKDRTECLMTTIHVGKLDYAIFYMYTNGSHNLSLCIIALSNPVLNFII